MTRKTNEYVDLYGVIRTKPPCKCKDCCQRRLAARRHGVFEAAKRIGVLGDPLQKYTRWYSEQELWSALDSLYKEEGYIRLSNDQRDYVPIRKLKKNITFRI